MILFNRINLNNNLQVLILTQLPNNSQNYPNKRKLEKFNVI
jgi:hypothetical protein